MLRWSVRCRRPVRAALVAVLAFGLQDIPMGFIPMGGAVVAADPSPTDGPVSYHKQIRPLFQATCQGCHQPAKAQGGFVMTDVARLLAAGDSGVAGIVPSKPEESRLLEVITAGPDGVAEMPKHTWRASSSSTTPPRRPA